MNIEERLAKAKQEIEQIQHDILIQEADADKLKETVQNYNKKKRAIKKLRDTIAAKEAALNTVKAFFQDDETIYDKMFPLFKDTQVSSKQEAHA
jgi:chromosome segregation ATPase